MSGKGLIAATNGMPTPLDLAKSLAKTYSEAINHPTMLQITEDSNRYIFQELAKVPFLGLGVVKLTEVVNCSDIAQAISGPHATASCRAAKDVLSR